MGQKKKRRAPDLRSTYTYSAQSVAVCGGRIVMQSRPIALRRECVAAEEALPRLQTGETVLMMPTEIARLRRLLGAQQRDAGAAAG